MRQEVEEEGKVGRGGGVGRLVAAAIIILFIILITILDVAIMTQGTDHVFYHQSSTLLTWVPCSRRRRAPDVPLRSCRRLP